MKNKILLIIVIFVIILAISIYLVYTYRSNYIEAQKINNEYKKYQNVEVTGTELASIMNLTQDYNEKFNVPKNENGSYQENDTNSIKMYIQLLYNDEYKTYEIERILNNGIDNFIKVFGAVKFQCTEINYHEKTKSVKELTFTEIQD